MTRLQMLDIQYNYQPDYYEIIKSHKTTWRLIHYQNEPDYYIKEIDKLRAKIYKMIEKLNKRKKFNSLYTEFEKINIEESDE